MKDIDTLEAQFKTELISALRRAANGRSPTLFSLNDNRSRSSSRRLRMKAERIMELRNYYSVDRTVVSPAASYLAACLNWEQSSRVGKDSAQRAAERLLHELRGHAT
jgi:hypothetical protein